MEPEPPRVLIVDDEPSLRALVAKVVERLKAGVTLAADGGEALRMLAHEGPFDVILLDLMMPRVNGFTVLNEFKKKAPEGVRCVIVMSAIGRPIRASDSEVVCAVVEKPFDIARLQAAVADCIAAHDDADNGHGNVSNAEE